MNLLFQSSFPVLAISLRIIDSVSMEKVWLRLTSRLTKKIIFIFSWVSDSFYPGYSY